MSRFIDSPGLFGRGIGYSTCGDFTCAVCGVYNEGYDKEAILVDTFAGLEICGDCFEKIEREILRRMPDILQWYKKILNYRAEQGKIVDDLIKREMV
jgi:hypothetical protein